MAQYAGVKAFLLYAKANNVLPTVLAWHEFDSDWKIMAGHVADIRQFMAANGINIQRISINEILFDWSSPGPLAGYLATIDRLGIESAAHACWDESTGSNCTNYSLDGILTPGPNYQTRGPWWVYKGYADITGTLVGVTPGATTDGIAGRDSATRTAKMSQR